MTMEPAPAARRWAERLDRRAGLLFGAMALIAFLGLLYLGRHASFFQDEWTFIGIDGLGSLADWFTPHNEHWSTLPFAAYRVLLNTIGLRSYLPYLALLLALHVAVAAAIFVLVRRASGALVALLLSGLFLVLGSGYQNLFWAFQIGFVGSVAAGLWSFVALDHDRPPLAAALLLAACACSSMGLVLLFVALVELAGRRWLRALRWVGAVLVAFLVWFVVIGRSGLTTEGARAVSALNLVDVPGFLFVGVTGAAGATIGLGQAGGLILVAVLLACGMARLARGHLEIRALAFGAGLIALFTLISLGRAEFGVDWALRSRYIYVASALLLVGATSVIGHVADPLRLDAGPRATPTLMRLGAVALIVALVAVGVTYNLDRLRFGAHWFAETAGELRATIAILETGPTARYTPPPTSSFFMPPPERLAAAIASWGSPAEDVLLPSAPDPPTKLERDRALWRLYGGISVPSAATAPPGVPPVATLLGPDPGPAAADEAPIVRRFAEGTVDQVGTCVVLHADAGSPMPMTPEVEVPDGGSVAIATDAAGQGSLRLGHLTAPNSRNELDVDYPGWSWIGVGVAQVGDGQPFLLELRLPAGVRSAAVCRP